MISAGIVSFNVPTLQQALKAAAKRLTTSNLTIKINDEAAVFIGVSWRLFCMPENGGV